MKQSQLFTHTLKELPKDETSYNAQVLLRAGFIDKVAGAEWLDYFALLFRKIPIPTMSV